MGGRWPVDQSDACSAPRCVGAPGRGARRMGGRRRNLPRLRLPPPAFQGPAEVPGQGLGSGEVQGSSRDRVPEAAADRRARARSADAPDRSRRCAATQERAQRHRHFGHRRAGLRHHSVGDRRPGREGGLQPGGPDPAPEADHSGRQ
ncbi:Uncharacterised protein [Mycobacteroides abscessus subsp. massiliense]|nr:Uncharacterised protein [Mycobacteroides abscessus subsp. massiliense]